jgi:ADP-heptose:LPS heptosyltransferase
MKTVFINPGGIGDQILLLPAVKLFKEAFPDAEIDLITEPRSACIGELTTLYRKVKVFNFKDKNPNIFQFKELTKKRRYKYLFATGSSLKANLAAAYSDAEIKIGYYSGFYSNLFIHHPVKLNTKQYTSNMWSELLTPVLPRVSSLLKDKDLIPEIKINQTSIDWAKETLNPRLKERYYAKKIFIHPGVSKLSVQKNILKSYSPKYWAALIEKLLENDENTVILIGGKDDVETINEIHKKLTFFVRPKNFFDLSGQDLSIQKLASLINSSDLLICVDSAPMHIGVALGKKLVAFFGPTDPKKLLPKDPRFIAAYVEELECRPCLFDTRKQSCEKPVCLTFSSEKMLGIVNKQLTSKS